ncbi:hypothetical protein M1L21_00920 [Streptomyces sp. AS02]|nr:hypothetical protein [Streptomyces sp. AS02]
MDGLETGFGKYNTREELQSHPRDVADHATTVAEGAEAFRRCSATSPTGPVSS